MLKNVLRKLFLPRSAHVVALILVLSLVTLVVYFTTVTSDAYLFADEFVAQDGRVVEVTGQQSQRTLRWLKGFEMSYGDDSGQASLTMRVTGDTGTFDVPLVLHKRQGRWNVVSAKALSEKGETFVIVE